MNRLCLCIAAVLCGHGALGTTPASADSNRDNTPVLLSVDPTDSSQPDRFTLAVGDVMEFRVAGTADISQARSPASDAPKVRLHGGAGVLEDMGIMRHATISSATAKSPGKDDAGRFLKAKRIGKVHVEVLTPLGGTRRELRDFEIIVAEKREFPSESLPTPTDKGEGDSHDKQGAVEFLQVPPSADDAPEAQVLEGPGVVAMVLRGPSITRIAAASSLKGPWHAVDLREPVTEAHPLVNDGIAVYRLGRYVYAFSGQAGRWGILKLPDDRPSVYPIVDRRMVRVQSGNHQYDFDVRTGRWNHVDLGSILSVNPAPDHGSGSKKKAAPPADEIPSPSDREP